MVKQSNNEIEFLNTKIGGINERRDKLTQEYSQLQRVLEHTETELAKVMGVINMNFISHSFLLLYFVR